MTTDSEPNVTTLREQIERRRAILVLGAGVSAAVTDHGPARSWGALIRSGVDYVASHGRNDKWLAWVEGDLAMAENDPSALVHAAQKVEVALGGRESAGFAAWLRSAIGEAPISRPQLLKALSNLAAPIATVNYDTFVERETERVSRTWKNAIEAQQALTGMTHDVVHLHGVWEQPDTLVFGSQSYGEVLASQPAQTLQSAIAALKCLVFVGCGDGLDDPNFGRLRQWLSTVFPDSAVRHYRLCRTQDVEALRQSHASESIDVIPYGDNYDDLIPFLESLRPLARTDIEILPARHAAEGIAVQVRTDCVLAEHIPDIDSRAINQLLIPPVVLPVSQEQYVASRRDDDMPDIRRCDIDAELTAHRCILLAADESSGLTSSLAWLMVRVAELSPELCPVHIDFRQFQGTKPLERAIRLGLRDVGVGVGNNSALPAAAVAIDNFMPSTRPVYSRTLAELKASQPARLIVGCRVGAEADVLQALKAAGVEPVLRYVGRLNKSDITRLAALVSPPDADRLSGKAVDILQREHLARTPLTVCLLISVLLHGEALLAMASETALLDAYVNLLLGRGDPYDDSRFEMDSVDRASLLASLAERFVQLDSGAIEESEAVLCFEKYFDEAGWIESATELIHNLCRRHVLVSKAGRLRFAQSSFLHLFAAKRAEESPEFLATLVNRPHYYAQIIKHYAALSRKDRDLLEKIGALIEVPLSWDSRQEHGHSLSRLSANELPSGASIDKLLDNLSAQDLPFPDEKPPVDDDPLDAIPDRDVVAFPVAQIEDAPPLVQILETLSLVSVVLRHSEQVKDLDLKRRVLSNTLRLAGRLVDALEADESLKAAMREAGALIASHDGVSEADRDRVAENFVELAPVIITYGLLSFYLTSRKLFRTLLSCYETSEFRHDPGAAIMGALMSSDIQQEGWTATLAWLREDHPDVWATMTFVRMVALYEYLHGSPRPQDEQELLVFLTDQFARTSDKGSRTHVQQMNQRSDISNRLRANRLRAQLQGNGGEDGLPPALPSGTTSEP